MGTWTECKHCGNDASGDMIYLCKDDNFVFCQDCGEGGWNINGNHNCVCPVCNSTSAVRIMGEINPDAYVPDTKCENCGNVEPDDMLYRCRKDDLFFCEQCGDKTWNLHGNNNCICPECHSTSDVRVLGEIGGRQDEEADDDETDHDVGTRSTSSYDTEQEYTPKSSYSNNDSYSGYNSFDTENDYSYSGSNNTSAGPGSSSAGGGSVVGWLVIIAIVIILIFWLSGQFRNNGSTNTISGPPVTTYQQPAQPDPAPATNPYGAGNGQLSFYRICSLCKVEILKDSNSLGMLPAPGLLVHPQCGDSYMLPFVFPAGNLTFTFKDDDGHSWTQDAQVTEGQCTVVKVEYQQPAASTAPDTVSNQQQQQQPASTETTVLQVLSPADHSSYGYPRYTNVEWTAVPQADSYEVELQLANAPYDYTATDFSPMPYSNGGVYRVTSTTVTVQGMGKQVHRLRVSALQNNTVIAQSDWRYFDYNN